MYNLTGVRASQNFSTFSDGIVALKKASYSIRQSIGDLNNIERDVVAVLANNAADDRPTGNGVDWGRCRIEITPYGVTYQTVGGLKFGWRVSALDFQHNRERAGSSGNSWEFFVIPKFGAFRDGSTLLQSLTDNGFTVGEWIIPFERDAAGSVNGAIEGGNEYFRAGNYKAAIYFYEKARILDRNCVAATESIGDCYKAIGDYAKARLYFIMAARTEGIDDDCKEINLWEAACCALELGNYEQAIEELTIVINDCSLSLACFDRARAYYRAGKHKEAQDDYDHAITLDDDLKNYDYRVCGDVIA